MARSVRVSVTLTEREHERLRRLAGREQKPAAEVAALLIVGGMERELQRQGAAVAAGPAPACSPEMVEVAGDIVQALEVEGVPAVLAGHRHGAGTAALLAANYLELISAWLSDPAPRLARGAPVRLADVRQMIRPGHGIAPALDLVGGADGREIRSVSGEGSPSTSDKRTLSDIAADAGQEVV